jgi:hypothetical protein
VTGVAFDLGTKHDPAAMRKCLTEGPFYGNYEVAAGVRGVAQRAETPFLALLGTFENLIRNKIN